MGYEILSEDLFDDTPKKPKKSTNSSKSGSNSKKKFPINPLYIHIGLIVIVIIALILFFSSDITFFDKEQEEDLIVLVGDLNSFDERYFGNFEIYVAMSTLKTRNGVFDIRSSDIFFEGFVGNISFENSSIVIEGMAKKIKYKKNTLNLEGESFRLDSSAKTNMELYFDTLVLDFENGRIKLNDDFNYEFMNTSISLNNFNTSFNYDGVFSFMGTSENFSLTSNNPKVTISYANE